MADEIVVCNKILDENGDVVQYEFSYNVIDPNDATHANSFCIVVKATEMTDSTSSSEAKTKANVKAAAMKTAWLEQVTTSREAVESVVGNVTL